MDKRRILEAIVRKLEEGRDSLVRAAQSARDEATGHESRQEGKYDMRVQTAAYLAAPQIYIAPGPRNIFDWPTITPEEAASIGVAYDQSHDVSEVIFITSRGGTRFDRPFMEAYIRNDVGPRIGPLATAIRR